MDTRIRQLAHQAFEHCCKEYSNADGPVPWVWEEKFAELIIDEVCEAIIGSDPSDKLILHEPYRTVLNNVLERLYPERYVMPEEQM